MQKRLLTTEMAAIGLSMSTNTLANWRYQDIGPTYIKVGGHVRYRECDIERWLSRRAVKSRRCEGIRAATHSSRGGAV